MKKPCKDCGRPTKGIVYCIKCKEKNRYKDRKKKSEEILKKAREGVNL